MSNINTEVNNALKTNTYPNGRIISGVPDYIPPELVNDIYKTDRRMVGNKTQKIYGDFSPNINEERVWNPITNRYDIIRGGIHYFSGDEKYTNNALTWQKIPSYQRVSQDSIDFINRRFYYGNNEQNKQRIYEAIRELNRKLAKGNISFEQYQAQQQIYRQQMQKLNSIPSSLLTSSITDEMWTKENKTSMWKMYRAIRNLEWEHDVLEDKINRALSVSDETVSEVNEALNEVNTLFTKIDNVYTSLTATEARIISESFKNTYPINSIYQSTSALTNINGATVNDDETITWNDCKWKLIDSTEVPNENITIYRYYRVE